MKNFIILAFLLIAFDALGQAPSPSSKDSHKGDLYFYWGWNRGLYTKSDIHFEGAEYEFELSEVEATDIQTKFAFDPYLNPGKLTIPQTNFQMGYFISEHYSISLGFDHMKYVVRQNQVVEIDGEINGTNTIYDRRYENEEIQITPNFLQLEHTDGLNYYNLGINRFDMLYGNKFMTLNATEGFAFAAMVPRTDAELLNFGDNDKYHLSGFGVNGMVGLNITFFNAFFVQSEIKGGYINMPDIRTTSDKTDKASQAFWFCQYNIVIGGVVNFGAWKTKKNSK